ncbi:unnamed protein product [Microthlaspi erraticum]|uniref:Uncharacterized protein n=1 Tax=Microthlaspi erraticum TaxID=1685480 RepID=A0A6D2IG10_9BRAS|nr:unnamed protein product [Microthlaspi erraticum]
MPQLSRLPAPAASSAPELGFLMIVLPFYISPEKEVRRQICRGKSRSSTNPRTTVKAAVEKHRRRKSAAARDPFSRAVRALKRTTLLIRPPLVQAPKNSTSPPPSRPYHQRSYHHKPPEQLSLSPRREDEQVETRG